MNSEWAVFECWTAFVDYGLTDGTYLRVWCEVTGA